MIKNADLFQANQLRSEQDATFAARMKAEEEAFRATQLRMEHGQAAYRHPLPLNTKQICIDGPRAVWAKSFGMWFEFVVVFCKIDAHNNFYDVKFFERVLCEGWTPVASLRLDLKCAIVETTIKWQCSQ